MGWICMRRLWEEELYEQKEKDFYHYCYSSFCDVITLYRNWISKDGSEIEPCLDEKKLLNKFGIKIVEWSCAPPIKNQFDK